MAEVEYGAGVLVSAETRAADNELAQDPIVVALAAELSRTRGLLTMTPTHADGTPRLWFMQAAAAEYEHRGGTLVPATLGSVARAVLANVTR